MVITQLSSGIILKVIYLLQVVYGTAVVSISVDLDSFMAVYVVGDIATNIQRLATVRRLSTCSYASDRDVVCHQGGVTDRFVTQWRWYFCGDGVWRLFGEVSNTVVMVRGDYLVRSVTLW
jgi:hypothetical protein